jgi:exopolysaccharide biosynthesis polyprenyl glycosylphosphotransferase
MAAFFPRRPLLRRGLALADAVALGLGVWTAHHVRFTAADRPGKWEQLFSHPGILIVGVAGLWALAVAVELYEPLTLRRRHEVILRVVAAGVAWAGAVALLTYFVPQWQFGRGLLFLTSTTWVLLAASLRLAVGWRLRHRSRSQALIVGTAESVTQVCDRLCEHPLAPWEPVNGSALCAAEVAGLVRRGHAEIVVLAGGDAPSSTLVDDLATLHFSGVPVVVASELWAWLDARLPLADLSPTSFFHQPGFGAIHWELFNRFTRVLDVILATLLLLLSAPVLLVTALAVLVADGRPVLYRQVRLGQFGRPFTIYKLRTMNRDAEEAGPTFASPNDPRVTRLGAVLRQLRLDELPQLVNVLRGDMSLVGPRPERPEFAAELAHLLPYYTFRLAVPPGLTGWAQVSMPYARTPDEHRLRLEYDLYFIRERSIGLYLLTLLRTLSTALLGVRQ